MQDLKLIERYEKLIERRISDVSSMWKISSMIIYFATSFSSFLTATFFHTFVYQICGGHCLFWAEVMLDPTQWKTYTNGTIKRISYDHLHTANWTHDIHVIPQIQSACHLVFISCMISFFIATFLLAMFTICGRGGSDSVRFEAPWRIVIPALCLSLIMTILIHKVTLDFENGYFHFSSSLYTQANLVLKLNKESYRYTSECRVLYDYVKSHNDGRLDPCKMFSHIYVSTNIMVYSWLTILLIHCARVLTNGDFTLLKVRIYEVPDKGRKRDAVLKSILKKNRTSFAIHIDKEKEL